MPQENSQTENNGSVEELIKKATNWLAQDPDPVTHKQLQDLVDAVNRGDGAALIELRDCFKAPLEFGTAGLRGALGPGPNRMNRVTVLQAIGGFTEYLKLNNFDGQKVVIGFDARYNSEVFARDSADVLAGNGFVPVIFDHVVPTPVLAFAIRNLDACAGIMVTASHNPPQDNGYKVYLGDGRQIVPPADQEISVQIRKISNVQELSYGSQIEIAPFACGGAYIKSVAKLINSGPSQSTERKNIQTVYTAMHGVGWRTLKDVFEACGFNEPIAVREQRDPDPDFPTVAFPNPEEKGALDLAIEKAIEESTDLLLANDPDADRLAVALPTSSGKWQMLRGDQVGVLLGWWTAERNRMTGNPVSGTMASSIVSSMMLESIATSNGFKYEHTLTGFKWVSRVPDLIYGYEEALGYCVDPKSVGDKDGISAAALIVEMAGILKRQGKTVWDQLDTLYLEHGLFVSDQVSVRVTDLDIVPIVMNGLRNSPPESFGNLNVTHVLDLAKAESGLPPTDGVIFTLSGSGEISRGRVIVRPSGTEPKIKCYLEVVANTTDLTTGRELAAEALKNIARDVEPLLAGGN